MRGALGTAFTSSAYITDDTIECHMMHISDHIAKFKGISSSLGNTEKIAILRTNSIELSGADSLVESIHQKVSTQDPLEMYKAHFSNLQNFFQSLENVLEQIIPY